MAERINHVVATFEKTNSDFIAFVDGLTDVQWQTLVPNEQRTVGVVAHHVAESIVPTCAGVMALGNSQPLSFTSDMIDQGNAVHAREHANATKAETLDALKANGAKAVGMLRTVSDSQLDNSAMVAFTSQPASAQQFAEYVVFGHMNQHLANLKAALA